MTFSSLKIVITVLTTSGFLCFQTMMSVLKIQVFVAIHQEEDFAPTHLEVIPALRVWSEIYQLCTPTMKAMNAAHEVCKKCLPVSWQTTFILYS